MAVRYTLVLAVLLVLFTLVNSSNIGATREDIVHNADGGYSNLLIAIDENVPEDRQLLEVIQELMWNTSNFLNIATNGQKFIADYKILVPATWSHDQSWSSVASETFERARILIAPQNDAWGDVPYTKQPGLCGDEGDYIHLTPGFLVNSTTIATFNNRDKTLVHEWAHLKYGLFDEYTVDEEYPWYTYQRRIYPTRCNKNVDGVIRDFTSPTGACSFDRATGLFEPTCEFVPDTESNAKASIMYAEYLTSVISFCADGEADGGQILHDAYSPNRQNRLCDGLSSWDVLQEYVPDFATDTTDLEFLNPQPAVTILHDYDDELVTTTTTTTTAAPTTTTTTPTTTTTTPTTTTTTPTAAPATTTPTTTTPTTTTTTTTAALTTTEFVEVIERRPDVVCLVLDVSGSMGRENRIHIMGSAVANYLRNYLEEGSAVGIVSFSSSTTLLADMTTIVAESTRTTLISVVPTTVGGGTSIGAGMLRCGEVLQAYKGEDTPSTRMFVLSDGQETVEPLVAAALPTIESLGITVDTIAYSQAADPILAGIASATGGYSFYFSGSQVSTGMQDALLATIERRRNKDSPITLVSEGFTVPAASNLTQTVTLDNSIGRDTLLVFTYYDELDVYITTPNNNPLTILRDTDFKLISVRISNLVNGDLTFTMYNPNPSVEENVVVSVTSRSAVPGLDPITATARVDAVVISFGADTRVNMYADVYRGLTPVIGVNVSGIVDLPDGTSLTIPLLDNGAGADSIANDGVYSGSMLSSQFTANGFYGLKVLVDGVGTLTAGAFSGAPRGSCPACKKTGASTGSVNRVASGGVISVSDFDAAIAAQDNFPPDRIRDLRLTAAKFGTDFVSVSWTAPGDDVTYGTVSGYEISVWYESFVNKTDADVFLPDSAISYNGTLLEPAGETVSITITLGTLNNTFFGLADSVEVDTYFFKIRAYDDEDNKGAWSNELSASFVNPADYIDGPVEVIVTEVPKPVSILVPLIAGLSACVVALGAGIAIGVVVCMKKPKQVNPSFTQPPSQNFNGRPSSGQIVRTTTPRPNVIIE